MFRSTLLDNWDGMQIRIMKKGGNKNAAKQLNITPEKNPRSFYDSPAARAYKSALHEKATIDFKL